MKKRFTLSTLAYLAVMVVAAVGSFLITSPALAVSGSDWRAGRIIDDSIFYNKSAMSVDQIQQFLNAKVPNCDTNGSQSYAGTTRKAYSASKGVSTPFVCLKDYQENPSNHQNNLGGSVPSGAISAAQILWNAGQQYNINPQVLIVMLQKEQALVQDDWPWPIQYQGAMGYGCPDTAACDSQYYGFYNQVMNAAHQFRLYANNPNNYNFVPGSGNFIQFNPNAGCGNSRVTIEDQATASLYNYTPYQPNQAALNNLYGNGDDCSAYGNRNFWRMYNDWFGRTSGEGYMRIKSSDNNDLRQWVVYGNLKQYIPDSQTLIAWGLQNSTLVEMDPSVIATYADGPDLGRLFKRQGDPMLFFADNGRRYHIPWDSMIDEWNLRGKTIATVPTELADLPVDSGNLTFSIKDPNSSDVYLMDGGDGSGKTVLRKFSSDTVRAAWEGNNAPYTSVSADYWAVINQAIGSPLTSARVTYSGQDYLVANGYKTYLSGAVSSLYPSTSNAISGATYNRLVDKGSASHLVKSNTSSTIYLVDSGGVKHQILWPDALNAWTPAGTPITEVNDGFLSLLSTGTSIGGYIADSGGHLYIVDKSKSQIPTALETAYRASSGTFAASPALMALFPNSGQNITGFIKGRQAPQVYMLDNTGKSHHLEWADKVVAWGGYQTGVTELSDYVVNSIAKGTSPSVFVSDGTTEYVLDNGKRWTVDTATKSAWNLTSAQVYSDGTLDRIPVAGALSTTMQDGHGGYYKIMGGQAYGTADQNIAGVWNLLGAPVHDDGILRQLVRQYMLTRFVHSSTDNRSFVVDKGKWYNLSDVQAVNLGMPSEPAMTADPGLAPNTITDWTNFVVKNDQNNYYVIDGGTKHYTPAGTILNQWTHDGAISPLDVTTSFTNLLRNNNNIERTIKGGGPSVYFVDNNTKRHILYPDTYTRNYAPYVQVGDPLIYALTDGQPIP